MSDFKAAYSELLTPKIVSYMVHIHEFKIQHNLFMESHKSMSYESIEASMIESVEASNRIDGITTSDNRIKYLVQNKIPPINQSEKEIAGYRDIILSIHGSHDYIPTMPSSIIQLYNDLYKYSVKSM